MRLTEYAPAAGSVSTQSSFRRGDGKVLLEGLRFRSSSYTSDAADYATRIDTKVVLIDGKQLARLMIDFDVGVAPAATYVVKRIDSDYSEES